jgi:Tol biopolymer transport system component
MGRNIALVSLALLLLTACQGSGPTPTPATTSTVSTPSPAPPTAGPTQPPSHAPTPSPLAPPPGLSGRLLFARFTEAVHTFTGMFTLAPDGTDEVEIPMPWTEGGGRWSNSGDMIAVPTLLDSGQVGTAILDPTGQVLRQLEIAEQGLNLPCTTWSPDDSRLACGGWDDSDASRLGIYTVDSSDGSDIQRVTTAPDGKRDTAGGWSADGKILFKRGLGDEGPGALYFVEAAGGDPVLTIPGSHEDPGRLSPDGTLIATAAGGVIQVYDLSGTQISRIKKSGDFLFGPDWSPDGAWLVFSAAPGGQFHADLHIARPDGTEMFQVTHTADNEIAVDWGPGDD